MVMNRKKWEKEHLTYPVPDYEEKAKEELKQLVRERALQMQSERQFENQLEKQPDRNRQVRTNWKEFVLSQVRFLRRKEAVCQFLLIGIYILAAVKTKEYGRGAFQETCIALSVFAPVLLMIHFCEIAKMYGNGIVEIEAATKHSLHNLVMARLIIYGVMDTIILCVVILVARNTSEMQLLQSVLYTMVPYHLMCFGCMEIMNRTKGSKIYEGCIAYGILMVMFFSVLGEIKPDIYDIRYMSAWAILLCVTFVLFINSTKKVLKQLKEMEGFHLDMAK